MYGNFEGWLQSNGYPWETYEDSRERYERLYGEDEPEVELTDSPAYTFEPEVEEEEEGGFLDGLGDAGEYVSDVWSGMTGPGLDQLQGSMGTILSDQVAGNLPESLQEYEQPLTELGNKIYYDNLKEAEAYGPPKPSRLEQRRLDDPNYQKALSKEEYIAQNPSDSWLNPDDWKTKFYKNAPDWLPSWEKFKETAPTGTELGEMIPSSIAPSIAGRVAGGVAGSVAGPYGTFAGQMAGGASASSLMTSAEVSREIRDNPTVRKILGLDPNVSFQDDSYENKNRMNKLAKMVAKNSFANRITSSGIPEMAGYMAFGRGLGGVMSRALVDVGGGTASELLDIDMSRRSVVESVVDFAKMEGNPLSEQQVAQLNQTLYEIGPKKREIFAQAFIAELALGAPGSMVEMGLETARDHRVDEIETDTAEMEKKQKELDEGDEKRLEVVGGAFMEIQKKFDEGDEDGAYELYKVINKENKKQNALSDLLQKRRYEDIYRSFLKRDEDAETAQDIEEQTTKADEDLTNEQETDENELDKEVTQEVRNQEKDIKATEDEINEAVDEQVKAGETVEAEEKTEAKKTEDKKTEAKKTEAKKTVEEEVVELIAKPPKSITKKLKEVAKAVGVKISKSDKPIDVVNNIKAKAMEDAKPEVKPKKTVPKKTAADLKKAEAKRKKAKEDGEGKAEEKEMITIYDPTGKPYEVEVVARSKSGTPKIIHPDSGKEVLLDGEKYSLEDASSPDFTLDAQEGTPTVSSLSDGDIEAALDRYKEIQKRQEKEKLTTKGRQNRGIILRTLNALKLEQKRRAGTKKTKATTEAEPTTVETTAPKTLIDRYNNALRNPKGETRITMPETHRNKDKTIKDVLIEWEDGSDTFTRAELQELGAIQKKGDRESYVANTEVKSRKKLLQETLEKTKAERGKTPRPVALHIAEGIKEFKKKNPKATAEQIEAQERDLGIEFLNKEKTKKLETTIEKETKEAEAKVKARKEGAPVEADVDGTVLSSATGKTRKKKSLKLKRTDAPGISKEGVQSGIETFKKNSKKKIKDMNITALSKDDDADVEIVREIYRAEYDSRGLDPAGKDEWVNNNVEALFDGTEGFVDNRTGDIYIVAGQIKAMGETSATDRLAQVLFHETIGHVGLRAFLGAQFDTFINRFLKTNKKLLKRWATEGTGQVYLPTELRGKELKVRQRGYDKLSSDDKFTIAEEYIAQHFAEHGARDPNLIDRIAVHIARALNKQGLYENVTTNEVKMTLAEVQQEYIGGNRNFISGENFAKVPLFIHHDDEKLEGETGDVEGSVEGIREAGLLSDEELAAHLAENPYTEAEVQPEGDFAGGETVSKSIRVPKKTVKKLYKLMEIRDGQLFYPFVEAKGKEKLKSKPQYPVSLGEWQNASFVLPKDMPGQGRGMGLAPRGGFHLTENLTPHLMTKLKDGTTRVWAEVEIGDDTNYQDRTGEFGRDTDFLLKKDKDGNVTDGKVPEGGQYRFRRPAREGGWWRIAGEMRLLRILPESESNTLLNEYVTSKPYTDALARSKSKGVKKPITLSGISKSIKLYHGSPKRFNKFIMDHVGTGAHGWGLYFTDYKPIAKIYSQPKGYLYDVNVPPKMGEFLDFNKSMDDQSGYIKERVKSIQAIHGKILPLRNGEDLYDWAASWNRTQKEASLFLSQKGIKGNKTAPSKFTNLGTKVYVLFNPDDVLIKTVTDEKTGKVETIESRMVNAISQSKALGLYAKYKKLQFPDNLDKDSGVAGSMLLHENPRPNEGKFRITFFDEYGNPRYHKHFPTLSKARDRLDEIGDDIQDISGGGAIRGVSKSVRKTYRDEKSDSTMDWVQDSGMRGAEVDRENLELELRWLKRQEEKKKLKGVSKSVRKTYQDERTDSTIDWVQDRGMRGAELDRENLEMELRWLREQEEKGKRKGVSKSVRKKTTFADEMAEVEERMEIDRLKKWQKEFKEFSKRGEETGVYEKGPEMRYNDWLSAQQGVGISKPKTDQVNISKEAKRRWKKSSINFSKRLRRNEIPQGTIIRDKVLLDISNIKGLSAADIKKMSAGNGPFIFMWDRMRGDGFYKTPSGVKIALQGGMSNSYLTYNMEAGIIGSSTSGGTISDIVTARVNESNGYGIVGLMSPSGHGSNPTFFLIYTQVIRDVLGMKGARRIALENKFAELIETGSQSFRKPFEIAKTTKGTRGDQRSNEVLKRILDAKTPKQKYKIFEDEGKKLTFDARKSIFTALGGEKVAKELGIPPFSKMLADTIDPEFGPKKGQTWGKFEEAGTYTGDLVQVMKFDKSKPLSTAQAEGLAKKHEHLSYDISFMGEVVGRFGKWIPLIDATKAFYEGDASAKIEAYRSTKGNLIPAEKRQGTTMMKMPVFFKDVPQAVRQQLLKKYAGKPKITDTKGQALTYEQFPPKMMLEVNKKNRTKKAINASKRLVSQSVNFSNSRAENYQRTRVASKGRGPLAGLARKLTRRLISQGTLEDFELYKTLRRKTKGTIMQMEQTADRFYKIIKKSKQQKEIYDYFTTPKAKGSDKILAKITDETERKIVVQAKKEIMENGRRLVEDHHLMTQKTLNRLDDQYLPRKYLKYLLRDKDYNLLNSSDGNLGALDLSYLNKRQDIEKGVRELILGEVKDPAFLAATAFSTPRKDMALLDFMESIATEGMKEGRGWVLPKTMVTFDTMGLMKQLAGESTETRKLIDELELMETKGVKVSGHWLVNESERIQNMTKHMELTPEKTLLVKKLTDRMAEAGKGIVGDVLPKDYMRVPKGRKYGKLQGMAIRKEIFEDLFGWSTGAGGQTFNINDDGTMDRNMAEKILGTGGTFEQYNRFWKWSKVSANPPSWVRNFVSNLIFMNMGPVPLHRMPDLFLRSLTDQISTRLKQRGGDKNNEVYDDKGNPLTDTARADSMGLTSGGFSQVELKMIKSNFEEAVRRGDPQEGIAGIMTIRNAFKGVGREETIAGKTKEVLKAGVAEPFKKYIQRPTSDLYGGIDSLGKIMMIKYLYSDKAKKPSWEGGDRQYTLEEAAAEAEKWLFDYSNPLPSVKYLRKSAFGAPFLSYPSFVAPLLIETILTKPWKFIPHLLFGEAMLMGFKSFEDISDEEYEAIVEETSSYIKGKAKGGLLDKFPGTNTPWIPRSIIPVFNPFSKEKNLDENGRVQLLQIGYLQPWGMFSDIFRQLDPTKKEGIEPAQALHTFGMLSSPLINIATTILTNRDPFTDSEIYDEFATGGEKLAAWYHYMFNLSMPPMVHGMSQVGEGKGFGALTRLIEHYNFTVTKEGEAKHTKSQALWRMVGINITPIAPHEARAKNLKFEVGKINRLKRRIKKNAEDAYFNGMSVEDIKGMVKKDGEKLKALYEGIKDRLSKPLPAKLKRTEKQRMKIMNEFLKKRKAG